MQKFFTRIRLSWISPNCIIEQSPYIFYRVHIRRLIEPWKLSNVLFCFPFFGLFSNITKSAILPRKHQWFINYPMWEYCPKPLLQYGHVFLYINTAQHCTSFDFLVLQFAYLTRMENPPCFTVSCNQFRLNSCVNCPQTLVCLLHENCAKVNSSEMMTCCQNVK